MSKDKKSKIGPEELEKLIKIISEAYEKAGKKINHAIQVTDIDEKTGELKGEIVIDNRDKDELN